MTPSTDQARAIRLGSSMNILHTLPSLAEEAGGPARSVPALARAIAGTGEARVFLMSADGSRSSDPEIQALMLNGSLAAELGVPGRFDLVHDHGIWQPFHSRVASLCRRGRIPRVVSPRGMLEPWALAARRLKKRIGWILYQRRNLANCLFLHATAEQEAINLRRLGLPTPVVTIANGTDLPGTLRPSAASDGVRTALFLSRVHPKKGIELLLEAWQQLRPPGWYLEIAGPGEEGYLARIQGLIDQLGLKEAVRLIGKVDDARKTGAYHRADLFVLPSFSENFGLVISEALAHGVPVITTTGTPWADLERNRCGWWVPPTSEGIAGALKTATALPLAELASMGRRGADWIARDFSWPEMGRQMLQAYRSHRA